MPPVARKKLQQMFGFEDSEDTGVSGAANIPVGEEKGGRSPRRGSQQRSKLWKLLGMHGFVDASLERVEALPTDATTASGRWVVLFFDSASEQDAIAKLMSWVGEVVAEFPDYRAYACDCAAPENRARALELLFGSCHTELFVHTPEERVLRYTGEMQPNHLRYYIGGREQRVQGTGNVLQFESDMQLFKILTDMPASKPVMIMFHNGTRKERPNGTRKETHGTYQRMCPALGSSRSYSNAGRIDRPEKFL